MTSTVLDLVGLATGAKGDEAELAGMRGLRAARLQAVLGHIRANYSDPAISAQYVAGQLGLSTRYVHDLLQESGRGFSDRVLELRLLRAKAMLEDEQFRGSRIGEIAFAAGFGDISYFNRSFRRRSRLQPQRSTLIWGAPAIPSGTIPLPVAVLRTGFPFCLV